MKHFRNPAQSRWADEDYSEESLTEFAAYLDSVILDVADIRKTAGIAWDRARGIVTMEDGEDA